jgi:tetratricopeptide (TPR) repeat protein
MKWTRLPRTRPQSRWALAVVLLLLSGCATAPSDGPDTDAEAETETDAERAVDPSDSVEHEVDNRAVALLWDRAEQAKRGGELKQAVRALERAVELAPEDAVLWSRLAEVRLRQRKFAVAENLAAKSNTLAEDQRLLRYRNWVLIGEARKRRGDKEGAGKAREQAEALRNPA